VADRDPVDRLELILERLVAAVDGGSAGAQADLQLRTLGYLTPMSVVSNVAETGATIPIRLLETSVLIGSPWTPGDEGPCPNCLDIRWLEGRPETERNLLETNSDAIQFGAFPLLTEFALDVIAALLRLVPSPNPRSGLGEVIVLDLTTLSVERHGLLRNSACKCFSRAPDTREAARLVLLPRPNATSGYRLKSLNELGLPVDALINPICGVLGANGLPDHTASATAPVTGHFLGRSTFGLHWIWWSGHAESFAKSKLVGLVEGLERYAGQLPRERDVAVVAPAVQLKDDYLDPNTYPPYPDEFYVGNTHGFVRWTPELECGWVWGYSIKSQRPLLVPEQIAFYLCREPMGHNFVQECSNGCAAGSTLEEAMVHGMLEVLERDAFLLTWYGGLPGRRIDMRTVESRLTQGMVARLDLLGYEVRCFDIRVDTTIPVVAAVAVRRDGGLGTLCFAAGCSLDPEDAVRAAVCEVASYVPSLQARLAANSDAVNEMASDFTRVRELEHHALLYALPAMRAHASFLVDQEVEFSLDELYSDHFRHSPPKHDLRDDVLGLAAEIIRLGSDVIVVDQTPPEQKAVGLCTVCTLTPGLLPIDFGWDKQRALQSRRLRHAPVAAGLRKTPLTDEQLNWAPHPFP
jgi:ribosomal protein S12 methylthiotransferase accessory factor